MVSKSKLLYPICLLTALLPCLFLSTHFSPPKEPPSAQKFTKISDIKQASDAQYIFLKDDVGQEWIYKQIIDSNPEDQMSLILEIFASEIAHTVNIPINHVRLISGSDHFEYRFFDDLPGSLHLKVSGKSVESSTPWDGLDIQQKIRPPFVIARLGALAPEEIGLRREVIQNMGKHPDLAKLAALDTYLGNNDRSNPNLFYDEKANAFYGIDMGNCFMGNLAQSAHEKLQEFSTQNPGFSEEELSGLSRYRQVLEALVSEFPSEKTIALLENTLEKAGFVPSNFLLWNEDAERRLRRWKLATEENYQSSLKLIVLLEQITNLSTNL